jgi:hypothetical protein
LTFYTAALRLNHLPIPTAAATGKVGLNGYVDNAAGLKAAKTSHRLIFPNLFLARS